MPKPTENKRTSIELPPIHHKELIALIQSFRKGRRITPLNLKSPLHKNPFTITLTKTNLSIRIVATRTQPFAVPIGRQKHSYIANIRPTPVVLKDIFLSSQKTKVSTGSVHELHSKGYSKRRAYYYRLIIPLEKDLALHYILDEHPFTTDLGYRSRTGHQISAGGETFTICFIHDNNDQHYLSIESNQKQTFDSFSDKSFSIQCSIAFVSGQFPGGVSFFFAYRKADKKQYNQFRMIETRKPIRALYQPVYTNPYGPPGIPRSAQDKWYNSKVLRPVSLSEFSILYQKILASDELRIVVLLLVQSLAAGMEQLPGGISIALEMLPAIILNDLKADLKPIKDKNLRKKSSTNFKKPSTTTPLNSVPRPTLSSAENCNTSIRSPARQSSGLPLPSWASIFPRRTKWLLKAEINFSTGKFLTF